MWKIWLAYNENEDQTWKTLVSIPLTESSDGTLRVDAEKVRAPTEEELEVSAALSLANLGFSIGVRCNEVALVSVYAFKRDESGSDPTVIFRTPQGLHVQVNLSNEA